VNYPGGKLILKEMNLNKSEIKGVKNPQANHVCDHCNKDITSLTYKLQQHSSSHIWLKHGQCCAACVSSQDIRNNMDEQDLIIEDRKPYEEKIRETGNYRTNIFLALSRAADMEDNAGTKSKGKAKRFITTGKIIGATGISAGFVFLYYELFILSIIFFIVGIAGIILCRLGVWKQCRID